MKDILRLLLFQILVLCNLQAKPEQNDNTFPWQQPTGPLALPYPQDYPIPIFDSPVSNNPTNYIVQSAIDSQWYIGIVVEDSLLRFKIFYYLQTCTEGWYSEGWIDKTFLAISPETIYCPESDDPYYLLYDTPTKDSYTIVTATANTLMLQPLEFFKDMTTDSLENSKYMAKIVIGTDDGVKVGWIDGYRITPPTSKK